MRALENKRHPQIPLPQNIYPNRKNSHGIDLSDEIELVKLNAAINDMQQPLWQAQPIITGNTTQQIGEACTSPVDDKIIGNVTEANDEQIEQAFVGSHDAFQSWSQTTVEQRVHCLENAAELLEINMAQLITLAAREGAKRLLME